MLKQPVHVISDIQADFRSVRSAQTRTFKIADPRSPATLPNQILFLRRPINRPKFRGGAR